MTLDEKMKTIREILEYNTGFHGSDATLVDVIEELERVLREPNLLTPKVSPDSKESV